MLYSLFFFTEYLVVVLADKEARLPFVLRKSSVARGLGIKKTSLLRRCQKGIGSEKSGVREGQHRKALGTVRDGRERG